MKMPFLAVVFVLGLTVFANTESACAQTPLDAVLQVKVNPALAISCQFNLPGTADQSFQNTEYRYAVLDSDGVQVNDALSIRVPLRTISLPKSMRSITDRTDASIEKHKLNSGAPYYFVVSVRNLTGLAKFIAP